MTSTDSRPAYQRLLAGFILIVATWQAHAMSLEQLLAYGIPGDLQMSPDGKQLVFTLTKNDLENNVVRANLWIADISSGEHFQLTEADERTEAPTWSPDGEHIAFLSDRTGTRQIWTITPTGDHVEAVLPDESQGVKQFEYLPGGGFAYLAATLNPDRKSVSKMRGPDGKRARTGKAARRPIVMGEESAFTGVYEFRPGANSPTLLTPRNYHVTAIGISPDGRKAAYVGQARPAPPYSEQSEFKLLDLATGQEQVLIIQKPPITSPRFSPDGKWIAFVSQIDAGDGTYHAMNNRYLQLISVDGARRLTPSAAIDEHVLGFEWAGDGESLYFWVNERTTSGGYRVDPWSGNPKPIKALAGTEVLQRGEGVSFSRDGRVGVAALSNATSPVEIHAIEHSGTTLRRLTDINQSFTEFAPATELMSYKGNDGLPLEALVLKPSNLPPGTRHPLLVIVHGGPPGVFTRSFIPRIGVYPVFAFTEAGYIVLLPNPRGSTGYGEQFRKANFRDLGGGDFRDILAGVDLLIEQGIADPKRLGLMGWSYGGYMAYWTVTHSTRFKAVSAGAGITNLISHHGTGNAKGYGQHDSIWQALPWDELQLFIDHSALFHINGAETPLLIQHGAADPIVPVSQAHEFHSAARRVGLPVEFVVYPGQPHSIRAPVLVLDGMRRNLDWFNRWLVDDQN